MLDALEWAIQIAIGAASIVATKPLAEMVWRRKAQWQADRVQDKPVRDRLRELRRALRLGAKGRWIAPGARASSRP